MHALPLRDPVAVFTVVLLVLLAAPLVGRRGVPPSVVLLGFGIALGPHALGVLDRDPTMVLLGTVGLLYLMFLAGLEIDLHEFAAHRTVSATLGMLTFALPQAVGTAVGLGVLGLGWPAAILLGSVFASHTLLAYPDVGRLGLTKARAATAAVGATILTDTLALLILAVIASGARGDAGALETVTRVALPLAAFSGAVLWGLPRVGAWFLKTAASEAALEFVFVLAAVFACALGVEALGVEPIIGAFLAGLALNRLVPEGSALMARVSFVGTALFVPFFLLATGMLVDLGAFVSGPDVARSWLVAGAMIGTVISTKALAAWAMRPAYGFSRTEAALTFGLTVPQAAATLAAALVGVEVGLFDAAILNGTIAMVFVTCLVGPWVAESAGRRLAAQRAAAPGAAPRGRRLLVSLANPDTADGLVDLALRLRAPGEPLAAVTVVTPGPGQADGVARAESVLAGAVARAVAVDAALVPAVRIESNPARGLARAAAETRAAALVLGWDGSAGAARALFGTISDRVLRETTATVVVARGTPGAGWSSARRLVVVSPAAGATHDPQLAEAATLLRRLGAPTAVLSLDPELPAYFGPRTVHLPLVDTPGTLDALAAALRPGDAVALLSARPDSVAWHPALDGLPREMSRALPETPLLIVTPGRAPETLAPGKSDRRLRALLTPDAVRDLAPGSAAAGVATLVPSALADATDALADSLAVLRPGVALAHARTETDTPVLAVGRCADGLTLGDAEVRLLVVLVLPQTVGPKRALDWLARLARLVGPDDALGRVLAAPDASGVCQALLASLDGDDPTGEALAPTARPDL